MFCDVFSFLPGVYVCTLNLIALIPGHSILALIKLTKVISHFLADLP